MRNEFRLYVGPMFGGKTTRMLSQLERYKYQNEQVYLFKPSIDQRYDTNSVVTHTGLKTEAKIVKSGADIVWAITDIADRKACVVAVDEAFMIPGAAESLLWLFTEGHTILVSSLQLSSDGTPYKEITALFPYATHVEVCPAVCPISKRDAYYTEKYAGRSDHEIEVAGAEMYRPRDFKGFFGSELND